MSKEKETTFEVEKNTDADGNVNLIERRTERIVETIASDLNGKIREGRIVGRIAGQSMRDSKVEELAERCLNDGSVDMSKFEVHYNGRDIKMEIEDTFSDRSVGIFPQGLVATVAFKWNPDRDGMGISNIQWQPGLDNDYKKDLSDALKNGTRVILDMVLRSQEY